jgi:hypothetical protein
MLIKECEQEGVSLFVTADRGFVIPNRVKAVSASTCDHLGFGFAWDLAYAVGVCACGRRASG